jgi:hypothetical protein
MIFVSGQRVKQICNISRKWYDPKLHKTDNSEDKRLRNRSYTHNQIVTEKIFIQIAKNKPSNFICSANYIVFEIKSS